MSSPLTPFAVRAGALCGVLSGLLLALPALIEVFTGETSATGVPLALSPAFALPLLTALHRSQSPATGRFGDVAHAVNLIGLGLFGGAAYAANLVLFYFDEDVLDETLTGPTVPVLIGSAAVFAVGCALFGAALLRARVFPRVPSWGYAVVLPLFAFLTPLPESLLTSSLHVLVGAILIRLSAALWHTSRTGGTGEAAPMDASGGNGSPGHRAGAGAQSGVSEPGPGRLR